ncbi:MAG: HAMP domain-containing histidine kinase [Ruminococcus sp.]|nr:HAMP domain-containing histidine kinase [Ruminococcus sp.]
MGKIKQKSVSLKWSLCIYFPICFIVSFVGSMLIGFATNDLQDWYKARHSDVRLWKTSEDSYNISFDDNIVVGRNYTITDNRPFADKNTRIIYLIISCSQFLIIPLWIIFCVAVMGIIFYKRELQKPIEILFDASEKISENQLDFRIEYTNRNELGRLCSSFDNMRKALYENNLEMWRSLEERKRLNTAFSHDLRTPLTVLKGYNDFIEKYSGQLTESKISEITSKMRMQIERLENYTYKMSALQKIEDIVPDIAEIRTDMLKENFFESGKYICGKKYFSSDFCSDTDKLFIDCVLVMEVYENIMSNAERYADAYIKTSIFIEKNFLKIVVCDDEKGFSNKALRLAKEPFFRDDREQNSGHFGLGLYICRIICEKCSGSVESLCS